MVEDRWRVVMHEDSCCVHTIPRWTPPTSRPKQVEEEVVYTPSGRPKRHTVSQKRAAPPSCKKHLLVDVILLTLERQR